MTSKQKHNSQDVVTKDYDKELTAADFEKELTIEDFSGLDLSPWDLSDFDATKDPFKESSTRNSVDANQRESEVIPSPFIKDLPPSTVFEPECPHPPELHIFGPMPLGYFIEHGIDPEGWDVLDENEIDARDLE